MGRYVKLKDTIASFRELIDGNCDDMPEQALYMVGSLDEAREQAKKMREGKA